MPSLFDEILDAPLSARDTYADEADELVAYLSVISPAEAARKAIDFNRRARAAGIPFHLHYDGGLWVCGDEAGDFPHDDVGIPVIKRLRIVKNTSNPSPTMPGFSGEKKDAAGRAYLWRDGHRIAKPAQPMQSPFSRRQAAKEAHRQFWADVVGGHRHRPLHEEPAMKSLAAVSKKETDAWKDLDFLGPLAPAARGLRFMLNLASSTAQMAVKGIAKEHGLPEEHVKRVADICGYIDLATSLTGLSSLPVGSIAYIALSTARHPVTTLRAAKNGVKSFLAEFHRMHSGELAIQKALSPALITELVKRAKASPDFDFWTACFLVAMDEVKGDVKQAMQIADGAAKDQGKNVEKNLKGSKARVSNAKPKGMHSPFKVKRKEGEVWQGPSGRWFTLKHGKSVPTKDPSGKAKPAKKPKATKVAAAPPHADGDKWETGGRWYKREGGKTVRIPKPAEGAIASMPATGSPTSPPWDRGEPHIGAVYNAPVSALHVDPSRFQFKLGTNAEGVTQELKSVQAWNPDFAGVVSVWKDPKDSKTYVVNGHHRRELAGRLGVSDLAIRYIEAPTHELARAKGALINIAEGRGTAVDAAKFLRDTGLSVDDMAKTGVSLKGKLAEDAIALKKLSDGIFNRVALGTFDMPKALAIAKNLPNHDMQGKLVGLLDKREADGKDISLRTIEEMAKEMAATPTTTKTEHSLFGDIESEESLFVERNEVKSYVRAQLSQEVHDFLAVSSQRRADRVGKEGNVLDAEKNRQIAEEAERVRNVFDKLVNSKGPISDKVNEAAKTYAAANGKKAKDAAKQSAVAAVKDAVFAESGVGKVDAGGKGSVPTIGEAGSRSDPAEPIAGDGGRGDPRASRLIPHSDILSARRKMANGSLPVLGNAASEPFASPLSGESIRRHVELAGGAKIHPDELHRAIPDEDGSATLGPENVSVRDPLNTGEAKYPSFERALSSAVAFKGRDGDRITLQGPHGYSATKTRGEWRTEYPVLRERPESFGAWHDRVNPDVESEAARNAPSGATLGGQRETEDFFAPLPASGGQLSFKRLPIMKRMRSPFALTQR